MLVPEARRTTALPRCWSLTFRREKCSMFSTWRSPTTMSASPSRIGLISFGMSSAQYWLSASVLTMTSAPSLSDASSPAWKPAARPLLLVSLTMWSTPLSRATSTVRSVEPSSMISHSTLSTPGSSRGRSASVAGSCSSSLKQGIWMINFIGRGPRREACGGPAAKRSGPVRGWPRAVGGDLPVQPRLQHFAHVALAHFLALGQHPDLRAQLHVAALVQHLAHVAGPHSLALAQHPLLLGEAGSRRRRAAQDVRAEQHGAGEAVCACGRDGKSP